VEAGLDLCNELAANLFLENKNLKKKFKILKSEIEIKEVAQYNQLI